MRWIELSVITVSAFMAGLLVAAGEITWREMHRFDPPEEVPAAQGIPVMDPAPWYNQLKADLDRLEREHEERLKKLEEEKRRLP